jgi:cytochrome P450
MALASDLELPTIDLDDLTLRGERFHEVMRDLRSRGWLAAAPLGYVVLDREAATFFLRTRSAAFPGMKIAELFGVESGPLREEMDHNILHLHGDDHRRLRNLVNPAFTPRAADRWRDAMRGFLAELFDAVAPAGRCEFVGAFAKPYPSLTIATLMGAPLSDAPRLHEWSNLIQRQFDGPSLLAERPRIERACEEFYAWAGELLERRRESDPTHPSDLISTLITARFEGDKLSDVELVNLVLNVLVGGVDTTQSQLAQAMHLFARHPDQWALLAERPELVPQAVEEVVRFEPITPFTARITEEDVVHRDVTFPAGTVIIVAACAANRDGDGMAGPDAFDITAPREPHKPLTFGAGIHYCLGVNLARAELQEALAFLAPRMPGLRLDGEAQIGSINGVYGIDALPLAWDGGSSDGGSGAP